MPSKRDLTPLLDTQQNQLTLVAGNGVSIDAKALALLATNIALMLFSVQATISKTSWVILALLYIQFAISLILDIFAIWPRKYAGASIDLEQHTEYLNFDDETLVLQLLSDTKEAISKNDTLNKTRWRYCVLSISFTAIGSAILFAIL